MGWHLVIAIALSIVCYYIVSWANHYLFTYLGDAEINGEWKQCFMYHTLTIPARIAAMMIAVFSIFCAVTAWASFIGLWIVQEVKK